MTDIDWSKAKAIHTHAISRLGGDFSFYEMVGENSQRRFEGDMNSYNVNIINNCDYQLIERPEDKPVFTQTMVDAGELPSVGMECKFKTTFFSLDSSNSGYCKIIAYHKKSVWICINGHSDSVINIDVIDFKPLTPPIQLVDGEAYSFNFDEYYPVNGIYDDSKATCMWVQGNAYSINNCTNIVLLTPENK